MVGKDQLQIGKNRRVELQIPPSPKLNFKGAEQNLRLDGNILRSAWGKITLNSP